MNTFWLNNVVITNLRRFDYTVHFKHIIAANYHGWTITTFPTVNMKLLNEVQAIWYFNCWISVQVKQTCW